MPTPITHTAAAFAISRLLPPASRSGRNTLLLVAAANLPDLDLLACVYRWDLIRYHHHFTHSAVFAGASAAAFTAWTSRRRFGWGLAAAFAAACFSHPLLDLCTYDKFSVLTGQPLGLRLAWPFSDHYWQSMLNVFPCVSFGPDLRSWVSVSNLWTFQFEFALSAAVVGLAEGAFRVYRRIRD